jgi:GDPmannose 4,6-dehydratase
VELAFAEAGCTIVWEGTGVGEVGRDRKTGKVLVRVDPRYFRPTEVDTLIGDASKARAKLGWRHQTSFRELVSEMVRSDIELAKREAWRNDRWA